MFLFVLVVMNFSMHAGFKIKLPCSRHSKRISIRLTDSVSNGLHAQQANQKLFQILTVRMMPRDSRNTLDFSTR